MNANQDIRQIVLTVIQEQSPKRPGDGNLQSRSVLKEVAKRTGAVYNIELEHAVLTQFHDLFRTGYLAWGHDISNPDPPFFHLTESGRGLLTRLSRDPGNPVGYRAHLSSMATMNPVAESYLSEGLDCYVNGLYKAAAVMTGAASESLVLELAKALVAKFIALGRTPPKDLEDWRIKKVLDALQAFFSTQKATMPYELKESFEANWAPFAQQIRGARNDAGHPSSIDPVTYDTVHASLLVFPELAKLQNKLTAWVSTSFT